MLADRVEIPHERNTTSSTGNISRRNTLYLGRTVTVVDGAIVAAISGGTKRTLGVSQVQ